MEEKKLTGYPSIDKPWLKYYSPDAVSYVNECLEYTMYQYMESENRNRLDYIALEYFGSEITYGAMFEKIEEVAKALRQHNVTSGDYVSVCLPNVPEIIYFIYALNKIGAVACLIDPRTNAEGILERANDTSSKILVTVTDIIKEKINLIAHDLVAELIIDVCPTDSLSVHSLKSAAIKFVYLFRKPKYSSDKFCSYKSFLKVSEGIEASTESAFEANKAAIIVYTSGTTGTAKGVMLSNENLIASKKLIEYGASSVDDNASFLGVIPFFSSYGACTGMNNSLCRGWRIIMIPKFNPRHFGKLLLQNSSVSALGVPWFWGNFAKENTPTNLSFLKNAICGGDKIAPASVEQINKYLLQNGASRLKIGYGASEFGGGIVITADTGPYEANSTGEILPGVIGMVINPDTGEELTYGEDGELCFHSPTMMLGYYKHEKETERITLFKDGIKFYRTGDMGHITENGTVYIVDRYKRAMMRPDGHTVHATPIENTIMQHDVVDSCAVVGLAFDKGEGVIPTAFVVLKSGDYNIKGVIDEIDTLCLKKIPERDKAHAYVVVEKLPYTPMGKFDYKLLERYTFEELDYVVKDHTFLK